MYKELHFAAATNNNQNYDFVKSKRRTIYGTEQYILDIKNRIQINKKSIGTHNVRLNNILHSNLYANPENVAYYSQ